MTIPTKVPVSSTTGSERVPTSQNCGKSSCQFRHCFTPAKAQDIVPPQKRLNRPKLATVSFVTLPICRAVLGISAPLVVGDLMNLLFFYLSHLVLSRTP